MTTAKPSSTSFDNQSTTTSVQLPLTINGLVFEAGYAGMMWGYGSYVAGPVGTALRMTDNGMMLISNSTFRFHSESLANNFQLVSLLVPNFYSNNIMSSYTSGFTVRGYNDGVMVASDTIVQGQSDTSGSVTYTSNTAWGNGGALTFNLDWANVDTVEFVLNNSSFMFPGLGASLVLDEIVLKTSSIKLDAGSDTGTSSSDNITSDTTPSFTGTAEVSTTVDIFIDGGTTAATTVTTDIDGNYAVADLALQEGTHTITAMPQGATVGSTVNVTIDIHADAPLGLALEAGTLPADYTPAIIGTAEAHAAITLYEGTTVLGTATADANGNWSITSIALDDGVHALTAVQQDVAGNTSVASTPLEVTIATDRPGTPALAVASDSGAQGDGITNAATPTLTSTAGANALVFLMEGDIVIGQGLADANGQWSIAPTVALAHGDHVLRAAVIDAGVQGLVVTPQYLKGPALAITIDTVAPNAPLSLALTAASVTDNTPTVTGTADADAAVTLYDGTQVVGTAHADTNGAWSITSSTLTDGAHALTAVQTDIAGNVSQDSVAVSVTVDTHAGAPLNLALRSGTLASDYTPAVTGTAEAHAAVTLYEGSTVLGTATADANGDWSITSSALENGVHALTAVQQDVAGNTSAASAPLAITVQSGRPGAPALAATSDSGTQGDGITNAATPTLTGTAGANATVFLMEGDAVIGQATADANGQWSIAPSVALAHGNHVLRAAILDPGVEATLNQVVVQPQYLKGPALAITIDTVVPDAPLSLALAGASDTGTLGDAVTTDTTPTVTGTAAANAAVTLYDGTQVVGTAHADANGAWSITSSTLADGAHALTAVQTDIAGNVSQDSVAVSVTVDTHAGAPLNLALRSGTLASDYTPAVTGTAEAHAAVTLYEGSTVLGTATADANGDWSITSSALENGVHALTAVQQDVAGNTSAASAPLAVTVQSGRPGAPVLADASDSGVKGDGITNAATPTLTGTAGANATVFLMEGDIVVGQGTADANGLWSIAPSVALAHGNHVLRAAILDPGVEATLTQVVVQPQYLKGPALAITIDTVAPDAPLSLALAGASDTGTLGDAVTTDTTPTVTGTAAADAAVTLYDGTQVVGTAHADANGVWSITSAELAEGTHALTAVQADIAGNVSAGSIAFDVLVEAEAVVTPPTTVDGVVVVTTPVVLPGGGSGTSIAVPIVTSERTEQSGDAGTADIPLSTQLGTALVTAKVHTGSGLAASGSVSEGADAALTQLIAMIAATASGTGNQDAAGMTGAGTGFLSLLPTDGSLLVQGVTLSGDGVADIVAGTGTPVAVVLDGTQVASGSTVTLQDIPFAAVFGNVTVTGSTQGQILTGDVASQTFIVSKDAGGSVLSGGGTDVLQFGTTIGGSAAVSASEVLAEAVTTTTTLLHGGTEADTAVFDGAMAAYTVEQHDGYLLVSSNAAPEQVARVVNVETLAFDDATITVENRDALTTLAGLYENVLGRQADVDGFAFWAGVEANGVNLGAIALQLITSTEGVASFDALNGDAAHDVAILYQGIFNRVADTGGLAWWVDRVADGVSLETVANAMTQSAEFVGHQIAATDWNFAV